MSMKHNVSTEEVNKITSSSNNGKRMKSIDSTEKYSYGSSKNIKYVKWNNITK